MTIQKSKVLQTLVLNKVLRRPQYLGSGERRSGLFPTIGIVQYRRHHTSLVLNGRASTFHKMHRSYGPFQLLRQFANSSPLGNTPRSVAKKHRKLSERPTNLGILFLPQTSLEKLTE